MNNTQYILESIITGTITADELHEKKDFSDPGSMVFDMIPMVQDLEVLIRNLLCLQDIQISGKRNDDAVMESRERLASCSYAVLRMIDTVKGMIARSTSDEFASELVRVAMAKHLVSVPQYTEDVAQA